MVLLSDHQLKYTVYIMKLTSTFTNFFFLHWNQKMFFCFFRSWCTTWNPLLNNKFDPFSTDLRLALVVVFVCMTIFINEIPLWYFRWDWRTATIFQSSFMSFCQLHTRWAILKNVHFSNRFWCVGDYLSEYMINYVILCHSSAQTWSWCVQASTQPSVTQRYSI